MKTYEWILFDADDTLFHFDAFSGLKRMFSQFDVTFTELNYQEYQTTNKALWVEYQLGMISASLLQQQRFAVWAEKLAVSPQELNSAFLAAMAEICMPIEGAISLLNALKGKARLGIITNGFTELQQARLKRTGLGEHFELLVISEQVGVAKPHIDIFEHALSAMGNPAREQVLMVGDTPESDILGGINARLDTCWVNAHKKLLPEGIIPLYEVASLAELEALLLRAYPISA
jgi:5'-nucleotidase